ncbi:MAG: hypothetical protein KDC66_01750 [Phaeodactylibacter sp.]|nr:hypothetical protein [Phaeodactylibacter sp.]MCB9275658.1 hypothetical protein [Lewinellaceae bacterium]
MCYAKRKKGQWGLAATLRQVLTGLVMLFLARGIAIGQEANAEAAAPRFMIKNGTTSLLDPLVPSFNLAVEYRWAGRFSTHIEGGPLLPFRYFNEPATEGLKGSRFRGAMRYYLRPPRIGTHAAYLELMYTYQFISARIEGDFWRESSSGAYGQRLWYDFEQKKHAGYLNIGIQQIFASGFLFETGAGLGPFNRSRRYSDIPDDASFHTNGSLFWKYGSQDDGALLGLMLYINLGYAF